MQLLLNISYLFCCLGRWIWVGNCLHKSAVATGVVSLISSLLWYDRPVIAAPACAMSLFCTGLYTVSWNYDPCCQYQVSDINTHCQRLLMISLLSGGGEQWGCVKQAAADRCFLARDLGLCAQHENQILASWCHILIGSIVRLADLALL